ncbi:bifunctional diguanylate cyclase/phosphodiesterase [Castellaniella sp.]|uniref:bifunctional diguanylate cyclase/phosphodiesterase n=1 Tax=Castellaniella sp. TaxID=1955812 RepID=UPI003C780260
MWIHPSYQADARRAVRSVSVLMVLLILVSGLTFPASFHQIAHYLPLHNLAEAVSVMVASLIFAVLWASRHEALPGNLLLLGSTFLGVALLDFLHLLAYPGMPDFITPNDSDKAIYFWLLARLLGALGLLAVAGLAWKGRAVRVPLWLQVIGVLVLVGGLTALYFRWPDRIPRAFIPGQGLTAFKVYAEYGLIVLYLAAALLFWLRMRQPRYYNVGDLFVAACVMAQGEFFLTLYSGVTDVYILFGHIYKVIAYAFLYRAAFVEAVRHPYALLQDSQDKLRATLDAMPDLVFDMDIDGRYLSVHTSRPSDLSAPVDQLLGRVVGDVLSPRAARIVLGALREAAAQGQSRGQIITLDDPDGKPREFELSVARKAMLRGHAPQFVVVSRDVTARLKNEQALRTLSTAVVQSPVSIIITDRHARVEFVNEAFTRISGYAASEVLGRNLRRLKPARTPATTFRAMWSQLAQGKAWRGEWHNLSKSGQEYVESVLIYPVRNAQGTVTNYLAHNEDVTEKRQAAERIRRLSQFDQLTGLPNRNQLREQCRDAMDRGGRLAALWMDLDHFKAVNDSLGHHVGDALLQEMAQRLRTQLPSMALLSRYSGDDFVAVLPGATRQRALAQARALLQAVALPLRLADQDIFSSVTIGVALYPDDAAEFDALLKSAETAMYRAKSDGRHRVGVFTPEMQAHVSRELMLGNALKQALANQELFLVYQPQLALQDGAILGAEALLRWESPQWGRVPPSEFIPIAEASGLIIPIGEWVLRTAMRQLRQWLDQGLPMLRIAVNLSAVQFNQSDLPGRIKRILTDTGVPAGLLELELTEAVAMKAPEAAAQRMEELSRFGVRFAIDDFGTGYSSLSYLKRFKLHKLKIDQSFVRDINVDPEDQAIAVAIIQLSRSLGLRTIAEGVETAEQQEFLKANGCEEGQGYYYSRPLTADAFAAFVRDGQAPTAP